MKSVAFNLAGAIRDTCVVGSIVGVLLSLSLFSQANFGRILGIVLDRTGGGSVGHDNNLGKTGAVGLLAPPEEERWECVGDR